MGIERLRVHGLMRWSSAGEQESKYQSRERRKEVPKPAGLRLPAASAPDRALPAFPPSYEEAGPRAGRERCRGVWARRRRQGG